MIDEIYEIIKSEEFIDELKEISSYGISYKQEQMIQFLLAKILDKNDYKFALEWNKSDLMVEDKLVELKFYYEVDFRDSEIERISKYVLQDIKKCDIFILIVLARDLSNIPDNMIRLINKSVYEKYISVTNDLNNGIDLWINKHQGKVVEMM